MNKTFKQPKLTKKDLSVWTNKRKRMMMEVRGMVKFFSQFTNE